MRRVPSARRLGAGLALTLLLLGPVGCARHDDQPQVAVHQAGEDCPSFLDDTRQIRFTDPQGTRLAGVEVGTGTTGFVLAHQDPGDVCDFLPYARLLARTPGYRVLCLDFMGYGQSDQGASGDRRDLNLVAAVGFLRSEGATRVLLLGASMGANAALVAGSAVQPPVAGVISLSAPSFYRGLDALAAAARLTVPVLYLAGEGDDDGTFATAAQALYDATPASTDRRLLITFSKSHGVDLLSPVDADVTRTTAAMTAFLTRYAPAGG